MALERRGNYVVGTQSEIDEYRSQQAGSAIAGTVAIAGVAVVLGVALLFISASAKVKDVARASAEQVRTWHDMYSKLWGKEKADYILEKARKKLRFRTFKRCIMALLLPILFILGIPLLLGGLFGIPILLAVLNFDILPYSSLLEIWNSFWHDGGIHEFIQGMGIGEIRTAAVPFLVTLAIGMPFILWAAVRGSKNSADIALLTKYNILIYQSYPKAKCSHCGKKTRVLSLGQCRNCFMFMRSLTYDDAKALNDYKMNLSYDFSKTMSNEFFSAEIGRTIQWRRAWFIVLLMFTLPYALFMGGIYAGAWYTSSLIAADSPPSASFFLIAIGIIIGSVLLMLGSMNILSKISNGLIKRDIRKFANAVKAELLKHNLQTSNWDV